MTIPTNIILPLRYDFEEMADVNKYLLDLIYKLEDMYTTIAQATNGDIRASCYLQRQQWIPVVKGATTPGTFTYTHQIGWAYRQGLLTDVWFDVAWSANAGAMGNLYVELPYKVANSDQKPFVGVLQTATLNYGAGQSVLTINAIPDSYRGEVWSSGSTTATANIAVAAAGQLIGHVRYIGVSDER